MQIPATVSIKAQVGSEPKRATDSSIGRVDMQERALTKMRKDAIVLLGPVATRYSLAACDAMAALAGIVLARQIGNHLRLEWVTVVLSAISVTVGGYMFWRALRTGAEVARDHLVIRGLIRNRRIAYATIFAMPQSEDVVSLPFIGWNQHGRKRFSPLFAFWVSPGPLAASARRGAMEALVELEKCRSRPRR